MHNKFLNKYYFINKFDQSHLDKQDKDTIIIFRNYNHITDIKLILKIKSYCKKKGNKFLLSNNIKLAIKLDLDGVYIPSFNNLSNFKNLTAHKKFKIIGSAHNKIQLIKKHKQGCTEVFIAPVFKTKKSKFFLGVSKFNSISNSCDVKIIALGGINLSNFRKLKSVLCSGFAGISWIKKTGLKN